MPLLTLTTDFGLQDFYAGALKGALLQRVPNLQLIDISHQVEHYNISKAAFLVRNMYNNFPEGTIHLVSVNDLNDSGNRFIALEWGGHYFLGSDNGLFSLVFDKEPQHIREFYAFSQNGQAGSFPLKAIYAKAVDVLVHEGFEKLGRPIHDMQQASEFRPVVQEDLIRGAIVYLDTYENAVVNITRDEFEQVRNGRRFTVVFRNGTETLDTISNNYYDVIEGEKVCIFNASGYMEIAINKGKAGSLLGIREGDKVQIEFE